MHYDDETGICDYVDYSEYCEMKQQLTAKNEQLANENEDLKQQLIECKRVITECKNLYEEMFNDVQKKEYN